MSRMIRMNNDSDSDTEGKITTSQGGSNILEDYPISALTIKNLREKGIQNFFPIQVACFYPIYEESDLIGRDRTGSGKTLAFALPVLERMRQNGVFIKPRGQKPVKLILVPTRELANQVTKEYQRFMNSENEYKVLSIYGGAEIGPQIGSLREGVDIVVGTPGRVIDLLERRVLCLENIRVFVLDEVDQMLDMGFQQDIERVMDCLKNDFAKVQRSIKEVQYLFFSATIPKWVNDVARRIMNPNHIRVDMIKGKTVKTSTTVEHLAIFFKTREDKIKAIGDVVQVYGGQHSRTIIFTDRKEEGNEVMLKGNIKLECQILNGDIPQKQREVTFQSFKEGKVKCLIATNLASRGLDFPEVDLIIQISPPGEIDSYIHRSGRTGRAGKSGKCITFYMKTQQDQLDMIEVKARIKFKKISAPQADDIIKANARDVTNSLSKVSAEVLPHFQENVDEILKLYDAREALSRALAIISGYTQEIKKRSLLNGTEGCVTFVIESDRATENRNQMWSLLKKYLQDSIVSSIRGLKNLQSRRGFAFDIEDKYEKDIEMITSTLEEAGIQLYQPKELPPIDERPVFFSSQSSSNRELVRSAPAPPPLAPASKKDLKKLFLANLPMSSAEAEIKGVIEKKGYNIEDIFFPKDSDGKLKGFGFVRFNDEREAAFAMKELQGVKISGRPLRIDYADIKN